MKKVLESSSNESSSENEEIERRNTSGKDKLRPRQKAKSCKPDTLTNLIWKQCKFIAKDSPTLESHQLSNHQPVKLG